MCLEQIDEQATKKLLDLCHRGKKSLALVAKMSNLSHDSGKPRTLSPFPDLSIDSEHLIKREIGVRGWGWGLGGAVSWGPALGFC